jgi:hypothetical protein
VVCDLCYAQTTLEPSTAQELHEIAMNVSINDHQPGVLIRNKSQNNMYVSSPLSTINQTEKKIYNSNLNINESLLNSSLISKSPHSLNNQTTIQQFLNNKREICREHNEEATYYCLDCLCRCICSECVVNGQHKSHQVMHVKKAYPIVIEKTEDIIFQVNSRIKDISSVQIFLDTRKKELVDNTNIIKNEINQTFEEIRSRLLKKEKEILEKADSFLQENLQELNTYSRVLQSKIISFNKIIDSVNANLIRRDEVTLLNYYSENKNKICQSIEADIPEIPDFNTINSLKVSINQNSFQSLIDTLNAIHVEISAIKGFEITKIKNIRQYSIKRDLYGAKNINSLDLNKSGDTENSSFYPINFKSGLNNTKAPQNFVDLNQKSASGLSNFNGRIKNN